MEASVAGGEAAQGETQEAQEQQQQSGFDPAPLLEGFEAMRGEIEQMRSAMSASQQQEGAGEEQAPGVDFSWLDALEGDGGDGGEGLEGLTPAELRSHMEAVVEQARAEGARAAQPALDAVQEMRIQQQAAALVQEFPAIGEPETAQNVVQGAGELAAVIGQEVGLPEQTVQLLANSPALWRAVFMAANAADLAQRQDGAEQGHAHLEGGGSRPAQQQVDPAQQIVDSGRKSVLPWS